MYQCISYINGVSIYYVYRICLCLLYVFVYYGYTNFYVCPSLILLRILSLSFICVYISMFCTCLRLCIMCILNVYLFLVCIHVMYVHTYFFVYYKNILYALYDFGCFVCLLSVHYQQYFVLYLYVCIFMCMSLMYIYVYYLGYLLCKLYVCVYNML